MFASHHLISFVAFLAYSLCTSSILFAHGRGHGHEQEEFFSGQETAAGQVVQQFHAALKSGDTDTLENILDEKLIVYESGNVERSLQEYASHHMQADIDFLVDVHITELELQVKVFGDFATSLARRQMLGTFQGKYVDQVMMETLNLVKKDGAWKIIHIHWSD